MLLDAVGAVLESVGRGLGAVAAAGVDAARTLTGSNDAEAEFEAPDGPASW